jgi:phosphoribosylformylglycinamidine cyclo-ligase
VVERDRLVTGEHVGEGDAVIGLPSPGLRSNGYSLARRVLLERGGRALDGPAFAGAHHSLADELLAPSVIYAPALLALMGRVDVRAMAHITGGGLTGNLPRVLPPGCDAALDRRAWETPRIFTEIQRAGEVADEEMVRVFNLGIGMVVVVPPEDAFRAIDLLRSHGHQAAQIGQIVPGSGSVRIGTA